MQTEKIPSDPFTPLWWLKNPHAQTCWGVLARTQPTPITTKERLTLPDGDFVDLAWLPGTGPIVIILHGLEGSLESHYIQGILNALSAIGWQAVLMHFRNCSNVPNFLPRSYHAGETGDIHFLYETIKDRFPHLPLFALGYSLGGSVLINWLTEKKPALNAACAVSVPFDLKQSVLHIQKGFSKRYQDRLVYQLKLSATRKDPSYKKKLRHVKTLYQFDDLVTAPLHGFNDAENYYASCSTLSKLASFTAPTLIIHSNDDPFHPPDINMLAQSLSATVTLDCFDFGGHVGFVENAGLGRPGYWLEKRIPNFFNIYTKT